MARGTQAGSSEDGARVARRRDQGVSHRTEEVDVVMCVKQAADYLGVSVTTIYRYADGDLPAFRVGNQWRFLRAELDAWMKKEGRRGVKRG